MSDNHLTEAERDRLRLAWPHDRDTRISCLCLECQGEVFAVVESIITERVRAGRAQELRDAADDSYALNVDGWLHSVPVAIRVLMHHWLCDRADQLDARDEFQNPKD